MAPAATSGRLAKRFWMKRLEDVVVGAISDFPSVPIDALFARNLTNLLIKLNLRSLFGRFIWQFIPAKVLNKRPVEFEKVRSALRRDGE